MGYGNRSDFTNSRMLKSVPGAKYDFHEQNSMSALSKKNNPKTMTGFFNKYDKWEKTCYSGMEQHFYGRETKGPGAYLQQDFVHTSPSKKASQFSVPRQDRGLLTKPQDEKRKSPGPGNYYSEDQHIKSKTKDATFAMPRAARDVPFSKYGAQHSTLIKKGLF